MRTGRYRVRRGLWGRAILQVEYDGPSFIAGQVDASIRQRYWHDVKFDELDSILFAKGDELLSGNSKP